MPFMSCYAVWARRAVVVAGVLVASGGLTQRGAAQSVSLPSTQPSSVSDLTLSPAVAEKVDALVAGLSSNRWEARQRAQDELSRLGPEIRGKLSAALAASEDEEVRTRIEAILRKLDENRVSGISLISIHMKDASPKEVFAEISKQAYTDLRPSPADMWERREWPKISVDLENRPFWEAMREVCGKVGVSPQGNVGADREMYLVEGNGVQQMWGQNAPATVSGAFLVVATNINCNHMVDLNNPKAINRTGTVQFAVFAEPKLRVLQGSYAAKIEEAVDDKGHSIAMATPMADQMNPQGGMVWRLWAQLSPRGDSQRIAKLKGAGRFILQTRSETTEVANITGAKDVVKLVGGRKFVVRRMDKTGETYVVRLTLHRAGWSQAEWNSMYNLNMTNMVNFRLMDEQGNRFQRVSVLPQGGSAEQIDINVQFQRGVLGAGIAQGEPAKLAWDMATESREIAVPFEFKDLPLP